MEKVYCYRGNYDGLREGVVIAKNQKQAAEIAGCSVYSFRQYWTRIHFVDGLSAYTLYTKPYRSKDGPWVEGRCALPK